MDWWRVKEGLLTRNDWVYMVLTFEQPGEEYGRWKTYIKAGKCWDILRKKINRRYGAIAYVQTWERHKKGGCHCNLCIGNRAIADGTERDWRSFRRCEMVPLLVSSGFGPVCWVERIDARTGALAGYITKLANELTGQAVKDQTPDDAPPHFRRIRASRGLLPKKPPSDLTGELVKCLLPEYDSTKPIHKQPCGCVGVPCKTHAEKSHAANAGTMADAGRLDGGGHDLFGERDGNEGLSGKRTVHAVAGTECQ